MSSVAAITSTAAISNPAIAPVICDARSWTTTGAPVTVYVPPYFRRNAGICTACRIHEIARACCSSESDDFSLTWMSAELLFGNRYAKRAFG